MDKLDAIYTLRIPEVTKRAIDKLLPEKKAKLNRKLLNTIAKILHEANFYPEIYLSEGIQRNNGE